MRAFSSGRCSTFLVLGLHSSLYGTVESSSLISVLDQAKNNFRSNLELSLGKVPEQCGQSPWGLCILFCFHFYKWTTRATCCCVSILSPCWKRAMVSCFDTPSVGKIVGRTKSGCQQTKTEAWGFITVFRLYICQPQMLQFWGQYFHAGE